MNEIINELLEQAQDKLRFVNIEDSNISDLKDALELIISAIEELNTNQ